MANSIRARLITIGDSHALLLSNDILEQLQITDAVELEIQGNQLIIRPSAGPRAGWAEQFQQMAANGDDTLLDDDSALTSWQEPEWND
jgi:antitoxin MazE